MNERSATVGPDDSIRRERDYYRSLLALSTRDEPQELIDDALGLLVGIAGAREGYLELYGDDDVDVPRWTTARGCDGARVEEIRWLVSRGIAAESIATGQIVLTDNACVDPRFRDLESVRERSIEAVVCAPIGRERIVGLVYLQGISGSGERVDSPHDLQQQVELFVACIAPIAEKTLRAVEGRATPPSRARTNDAFSSVIGRSAVIRELVEHLRFLAPLDRPVLLTGPTGTGKSLMARAVHAVSPRAARPFVDLNCATLPEDIFENEMFGAEPGAHSAVPRGGLPHVGKVEHAEGGTLFLDEIAELSWPCQAKLLQLLQTRKYSRLGGREKRADVRLIAATHVDLEQAVAERRFREDLYYRLNVVDVRIPALRERPHDIVPLAAHFAEKACRDHGWPVLRLAPSALRALTAAEWPGNVRELENCVVRGTIQCAYRKGDRIESRDLFRTEPRTDVIERSLHGATREFQKGLLSATLAETDWNVSEAARRLEIARSHLYELINSYGLRRG